MPPKSRYTHEHDHEHGHGYGQHSQDKHSRMMANLVDCQVLLAGGMGMGAHESLQRMGITPVLTDMGVFRRRSGLTLTAPLWISDNDCIEEDTPKARPAMR